MQKKGQVIDSGLQDIHLNSEAMKVPKRVPSLDKRNPLFGPPFAQLKIGPNQEVRLSLGIFSSQQPALGFSVELAELTPAGLEELVTVKIVAVGSGRQYELWLSAKNHSETLVTAEIRAMRSR